MSPEPDAKPDHFDRAMDVFAVVCRLDAQERAERVAQLCADEPGLRAEVESLLVRHDRPQLLHDARVDAGLHEVFCGLVDGPPGTRGGACWSNDAIPPERIGDYQIVRKIGEGGMGTVYEARQHNPRRTVALKVMRGGSVSASLLRRFEFESHILGQLHHPGIAQIYEAGVAGEPGDARPFFAMEFIKGEPLVKYADQHHLSVRERLELLSQICDAVQHAHVRGVVHRDLKPSNILVDLSTGEARPKVLDFGIARATDSELPVTTLQTGFGQLIGTLPYMSPEQVSGDPDSLDTRSDVYALGVILHELLTGRLPIDLNNRSVVEAVRMIQEVEPERLSAVSAAFRGDIDTIVSKALEKQRERRYQSAADLASDIRRHLADEPIIARPTTAFYRVRKFAKRNKAMVAGLVATFLALIVGLVGMTWRAEREARQREEAERQAYRSDVAAALAALQSHDLTLARRSLDEAPLHLRGWEWRYLDHLSDQSRLTLQGHTAKVRCAATSPDNQLIASAADDHTIRIWNAVTGVEQLIIDTPEAAATALAFSPDHAMLLASFDQQLVMFDSATATQLWKRPGKATLTNHAFFPDGTAVAVGLQNSFAVTVLDARTGQHLHAIATSATTPENIQVLPDGIHVFLLETMRYRSIVLNTQTGKIEWEADVPSGVCGGGLVLGANEASGTSVLDAVSHQEVVRTNIPAPMIQALSRHEDKIMMAMRTAMDQTVLCDAGSSQPYATLVGHGPVFTFDGKNVITVCDDHTLKMWDTNVSSAPWLIDGLPESGRGVVSSDAQRIITLGWGSVSMFDSETGMQRWTAIISRSFLRAAAFSHDNRRAVVGGRDANVMILDVDTGQVLVTGPALSGEIRSLAWSPDGQRIAAGTVDGRAHLLQAADGKEILNWVAHQGPMRCAAFSPDSSMIATASGKGSEDTDVFANPDCVIRLWDAAGGSQLKELRGHTDSIMCLSFSADQQARAQLASGSADRTVRLWNVNRGELLGTIEGMSDSVWAVAFAPPGERLPRIAAGSARGALHIWNPESLETMIALNATNSNYTSLAFSPDCSMLVGAGTGTSVLAFETVSPPCGFETRRHVRKAQELVDRLYRQLVFSEDIIAYLKGDTTLPAITRTIAMELVTIRGDQPMLLNSTAWGLVRVSNNPSEQYQTALRASTLACKIWPNDYNLLNTLGVAQYRAGQYPEAAQTLMRCDAMHRAREGTPHPVDLAVLAMTQFQLGEIDAAGTTFAHAQELMRDDTYSNSEENQSLVREAADLLHGMP